MLYILIGLVLLVAVLLMIVVLAQEPKGSGIAKEFGGAGANQIMGAKNTTNIMEKITWSLIAIVFVGSIAATLVTDAGSPTYVSPNVEKAKQQVTIPDAPALGADAVIKEDAAISTDAVIPADSAQ